MGYQKLTGAQAILGGAVILTSPTIYTNLSTSTSSMKIYGAPIIYASSTDTADGRIQVGGGLTSSTSEARGGISLGGATKYVKKIPFTSASWTTSVTTNFNTAFQLPASSFVTDAWFHLTSPASSLTITAGTTGDPNGFLTGITGTGVQVGVLTAGSQTYGVLLYNQITTTIAADARVNYAPGAAVNVAIGRSATNLTMPAGNLFIEYIVPGA
jgi:hypothetical protein